MPREPQQRTAAFGYLGSNTAGIRLALSDAVRSSSGPRRQSLALVLVASLVSASLAACGGPTWPGSVRGVGDPRFMAHEQVVETVDVLPVDLQVWTVSGHKRGAEAVAGEANATVAGLVTSQLARRGYEVVAAIDREGRYVSVDGTMRDAMTPEEVESTTMSLSSYGVAQSQTEGALLMPFLPARLGAATGSDTTLYIGGWAYAGKDKSSNKAAKVIGVVLVVGIIAVIAIALIAGEKGGGSGLGKVAEGAGHVAGSAVKVVGRVAVGAARTAGRVGVTILRDPELFHLTVDTIDAFARAGTHVEVQPARPDYYARGPRKGRSAMLLEMTLVDNHSGKTLWHARQRFPASPEKPAQVEKAVARLMATLPAR